MPTAFRSCLAIGLVLLAFGACTELVASFAINEDTTTSETDLARTYGGMLRQFHCAINTTNNNSRQLHLFNCSVAQLEANVFSSFSQANELIVANSSELRTLDDLALQGLRQLESLALVGNRIVTLKRWSSHYFNALHRLDFDSNEISEIASNALTPYPNADTLSVADNQIKRIPDRLFANSSRLTSINFDYNQLTLIGLDDFLGLHHLTELSLSHNQIRALHPSVFRTNNELRILRIDGNRLQTLEANVFYSTPQLVMLNLSSNSLSSIVQNSFDLSHQLRTLDLSRNKLVKLRSDWANGLQRLVNLDLCHNQLETLNFVGSLVDVKYLNLSDNRLADIQNASFTEMHMLEQINLARNRIEYIEHDALANLHNLKSIDLTGNSLSDAHFLWSLSSLRYLSMANNHFRTINLTLFFQFHNVDLTGNPWSCAWLIEEMVSASEGVSFGRNFSIDDQHQGALTVPGIDCTDESGRRRSIVVLQLTNLARNAYTNDPKKQADAALTQQNKTIRKLLDDEFDYKACLIWVAIAVIAVFGIVHLGKVLFARSELNSEKYRLSQQVGLLTSFNTTAVTTPITANKTPTNYLISTLGTPRNTGQSLELTENQRK